MGQWNIRKDLPNPIYSYGLDYKDGKVFYFINFDHSSVEIDITNKCKVKGCPMVQCLSCINFLKLDYKEIFEKYIKPELTKEREE